ncbi:uncharacterized protein LOC110455430 isoform X2 [Mizuhopecten yessoensis]|uniref:uncharacterized protein LOC110455430 isoform X2 n=1 Tax=Mizuhopecten yessoensis TaxID=6573 RepID=UPI000B459D10|nr:uncharacterized protein LOC110455430 isoform X2 [Mizuhopecten yessoensis]
MFGVIASSAGCKGPSHSSSSSNKHQSNHDNHQCRGSQDIKEKSGHHKNKESSSKKHGAFSINQAIGTSLSCVGGSQQFARELGIKASVAPKT